MLRGLAVFYLIYGAGAVANLGVASHAFASSHTQWLAGGAGAVVRSVWDVLGLYLAPAIKEFDARCSRLFSH
jgi:hypothetical protein